MTDAAPGAGRTLEQPEQRASWLELFFDLVVVVAIATLAERLSEDPGWADVVLVLELYLAIWLVWVSFMLYGNVAGESTHRRTMILAMGCIAVMAASVPGVHEAGPDRARAFAVAYVVARLLAIGVWRTTQRALADWPIAWMSIGLVPWIVSIWVPGDARFWLWGLGMVLDVGFAVLRGNDPIGLQEMLREETAKRSRRGDRGRDRGRQSRPDAEFAVVGVNVSHFEERLGVFMIIVLGEAVSQIVLAASGRTFDDGLPLAAGAAFVLLVGLWWLTFQYGFAASPEAELARMPARFGLPVHYLTTASIIFLATGLGESVAEPLATMGAGPRWLAAGGLAGYFLVTSLAALAIGAGWAWLAGWGLPSVLLPVAVGIFGGSLAGWGVTALLLLAVGWQVSYGWLKRQQYEPAGAAVD